MGSNGIMVLDLMEFDQIEQELLIKQDSTRIQRDLNGFTAMSVGWLRISHGLF